MRYCERDLTSKRNGVRALSTTLLELSHRNTTVSVSGGVVEEFDGKIFRVVTLGDKRTIHNAFPDRGFKHET
jgi:hypothetical protein